MQSRSDVPVIDRGAIMTECETKVKELLKNKEVDVNVENDMTIKQHSIMLPPGRIFYLICSS